MGELFKHGGGDHHPGQGGQVPADHRVCHNNITIKTSVYWYNLSFFILALRIWSWGKNCFLFKCWEELFTLQVWWGLHWCSRDQHQPSECWGPRASYKGLLQWTRWCNLDWYCKQIIYFREWIWTGQSEYWWLWLLWSTLHLLRHWGDNSEPWWSDSDIIQGDVELATWALERDDTELKIPFMNLAKQVFNFQYSVIITSAIGFLFNRHGRQVSSKDLKMYGSPWSAPAWMKSNNALNGQVL